jgi:hypothetical protein
MSKATKKLVLQQLAISGLKQNVPVAFTSFVSAKKQQKK